MSDPFKFPPFLSDVWFDELIVSAGVDALVGGTVAEIHGGSFWRGAADAAMWGAAGYVVSSVLNKDVFDNSVMNYCFGYGKIKRWISRQIARIRLAILMRMFDPKVETFNGVDILTYKFAPGDRTNHDRVGILGDAELDAIIRDDISRVNKWRRWQLNAKKMAGSKGDSAFGPTRNGTLIRYFSYKGVEYHTSDVNYILQGHIHAHSRLTAFESYSLVESWKAVAHKHRASDNTLKWAGKGYREYEERKDW